MLPHFEVIKPKSLEEAVKTLAELGDRARVFAGGTDLLLQLREDIRGPERLVDIKGLGELKGFEFTEDNGISIGAVTTHRHLECSDLVRDGLPILHDGVKKVGSVQTRTRGTIGGNICSALPSADTAAPLLALKATVHLHGSRNLRTLPIDRFFLGPGKTALRGDEVLTHVVIPPLRSYRAGAYIKFTRREAMDLALVGVAVFFEMEEDHETCREARIALATAAPTPIRVYNAESKVKGRRINRDVLMEAGEAASREAKPRSSWRCTEAYRRHLIKVLVPRAGMEALKRQKGEGSH